VVVADPTQTKAIGYAEVKNDRLDEAALVVHGLVETLRY
jgi:hypothetical protein